MRMTPMNGLFPEKPILLYPSHIKRYGADEAILLWVYHEYAQHYGVVDVGGETYFIVRRSEWLALTSFWDEDQLAKVTHSLIEQHLAGAEFLTNGSVRIQLLPVSQASSSAEQWVRPAPFSTGMPAEASTPVLDPTPASIATPPLARELYTRLASNQASGTGVVSSLAARGPAPSFGGSTGWNRNKDELETLFDQHERRNQQLHEIHTEWRPSETTYQMLDKQNIPKHFADAKIDEFIAYWLERDRREVSWDPHFIRLIKREWVKQQGREARVAERGVSEKPDERYQADNRAERRQRVTESLMDIKNIDW
jgi:hypothetical protein